MTLIWNESAITQLEQDAAERLLRCAITLQTEHSKRLNVSNPGPKYLNPAPVGTYPHARTGFLKSNVFYEPTSIAEIIRGGFKVRIGYGASAFYGACLQARGWKGIIDTALDIRGELEAILGRAAVITVG